MDFRAYQNAETRKAAASVLYMTRFFNADEAHRKATRDLWFEQQSNRWGHWHTKTLDFRTIAKALDRALGLC